MSIHLKPLDRQVVVLTGASSGIGLCTARQAAERGACLVLVARSTEVLDRLAAELNGNAIDGKRRAVVVAADVSDRRQLEEVPRVAIDTFGRIDTWINNAGVSIFGRLDQVDEKDSRRMFDINFWGVVNGSLIALPHLKREGGALINLGSEASDAVIPLQGMYSASKHAVKGFTDALRVEIEDVDKSPVSITLIQPTAVNTPYPEHARNYMDQEPKLPDPMIDPEDVARAILKAATEGGRDIKVGSMSVLNTTMSKIMPSVADKMSARQVDRQQKWEDPKHPQGTLYEPGHSGRTHGRAEIG